MSNDFFRKGDEYLSEVLASGKDYPKFEERMHVKCLSPDGYEIIGVGEILNIEWSRVFYDHFYEIYLDSGSLIKLPTYLVERIYRTHHLRAV